MGENWKGKGEKQIICAEPYEEDPSLLRDLALAGSLPLGTASLPLGTASLPLGTPSLPLGTPSLPLGTTRLCA